jgi:hypothetical protein
MGADIHLFTDKSNELLSSDEVSSEMLSRTFCYLMCRRNIIHEEPELDQVGKITAVDISPIYEMELSEYSFREEADYLIEAGRADEAEALLHRLEEEKVKLSGNIEKVLYTVKMLLSKLDTIENLPELLDNHGRDTLDSKVYFSKSQKHGDGDYFHDNFEQDLLKFKSFLQFSKSKGAATVYFNYL